MKNLLFTSFAILVSLSSLAETKEFFGGSSRTSILDVSPDDDIILNSSTGSRYGSTNIVVKSIVATNGADVKGAVDIANSIDWIWSRGPNVDINAASGEVSAISAASWKQNNITLTVKNSAVSSTATALVDFGSSFEMNSGTQNQSLIFDSVNANVSSETAIVGTVTSTLSSTVTVKSSANVDWTGSVTYGKSSVLNVDGKLTMANDFISNAGSKLNLSGELELNSQKTLYLSATVVSSGKLTQTGTSDIGTYINTVATLNSGSDWTAVGKVIVNSGATLVINDAAKYNIVSVDGKSRFILNNGTIKLNGANAVSANGSGVVSIVTINNSENVDRLYIGANQTLNTLYINESTLEIYLSDGVSLILSKENEAIGYAGNGNVKVYNFQEDSIYVGSNSTIAENVSKIVKLYDSIGDLIGSASVNADGYITVAVPEPASIAAIFGALAIMFAIRRRSK